MIEHLWTTASVLKSLAFLKSDDHIASVLSVLILKLSLYVICNIDQETHLHYFGFMYIVESSEMLKSLINSIWCYLRSVYFCCCYSCFWCFCFVLWIWRHQSFYVFENLVFIAMAISLSRIAQKIHTLLFLIVVSDLVRLLKTIRVSRKSSFKWRVTVSEELMFLESYSICDVTNTVTFLLWRRKTIFCYGFW